MNTPKKRIGVLSLQGGFAKHIQMITNCGATALEIRNPAELKQCDGLILPGGESTTLTKLINRYQFRAPLLEFAKSKPILGTCAGAILLSKHAHDDRVQPLGLIDIDSHRNAYGRQVESFSTTIDITGLSSPFEAIFIRAPQLTLLTNRGEILAQNKGKPVFVRQKNIFALTFHPELTHDSRIHELFLKFLP